MRLASGQRCDERRLPPVSHRSMRREGGWLACKTAGFIQWPRIALKPKWDPQESTRPRTRISLAGETPSVPVTVYNHFNIQRLLISRRSIEQFPAQTLSALAELIKRDHIVRRLGSLFGFPLHC